MLHSSLTYETCRLLSEQWYSQPVCYRPSLDFQGTTTPATQSSFFNVFPRDSGGVFCQREEVWFPIHSWPWCGHSHLFVQLQDTLWNAVKKTWASQLHHHSLSLLGVVPNRWMVHRFLHHTNTEGEIVVLGKTLLKNFINIIHVTSRPRTHRWKFQQFVASRYVTCGFDGRKVRMQSRMKEKYFYLWWLQLLLLLLLLQWKDSSHRDARVKNYDCSLQRCDVMWSGCS